MNVEKRTPPTNNFPFFLGEKGGLISDGKNRKFCCCRVVEQNLQEDEVRQPTDKNVEKSCAPVKEMEAFLIFHSNYGGGMGCYRSTPQKSIKTPEKSFFRFNFLANYRKSFFLFLFRFFWNRKIREKKNF